MERNLENLFREKITVAERKPVAWNKEHTWHLIKMSLTPESGARRFIHAAASILLILTFTSILKNQLEIKAKSDDTAGSTLNKTVSPATKNKECEPEAQHGVEQTVQKVRANLTSEGQYPLKVEILNDSTEVTKTSLTQEAKGLLTEVETPVELPHTVQNVEPIIGVIIPEEKKSIVVTGKKVRFRLLRSSEKSLPNPSDEGDIKTLFARIN